MCKKATLWGPAGAQVILALCLAATARGQAAPQWRSIGPMVIEKGLAGVSAGPVRRVWFAPDGNAIYLQTGSGRLLRSDDAEHWVVSTDAPPGISSSRRAKSLPETGATIRAANDGVLYAFGAFVYRSIDDGRNWDNLTAFHGRSIIGGPLRDLAVGPLRSDELLAAGDDGIFRSMDGGLSWSSLNGTFPNLHVRRILALPKETEGARVSVTATEVVTLPPGEKHAWLPSAADDLSEETASAQTLGRILGIPITAVAFGGPFTYAGTVEGALYVSSDGGETWRQSVFTSAGAVERIWIDVADPRTAIAAFSERRDPVDGDPPFRIARTRDGGSVWDDLTFNLPPGPVHGVAVDQPSHTIYAATGTGLYTAIESAAALQWALVPGLPSAEVSDVRLDSQGNQLWAAVDGYGVFAAMAPHRLRDPRIVSAADSAYRAVAPGSVLTILGVGADSVRAGDVAVPVLAATRAETQIQIPFDVASRLVSLDAQSGGKSEGFPAMPILPAVPAIYVDLDGSPMALDAETGAMLDAEHPAQRGSRVQVLAAGLGRVLPEWPAGVPAPPDNSPRVSGTVHAFLNGASVEVTHAALAPGYVGMYLVEVVVPAGVPPGRAEFYLDVDGAPSNRIPVYIEP